MSTDTDSKSSSSESASARNSEPGECPICYESFWDGNTEDVLPSDVPNPLERIQIQGCEHAFCRECLRQHCKHALSQKRVGVFCPSTSCHYPFSITLKRALLLQESVETQNNDDYLLQNIASDDMPPIHRTVKRERLETQESSSTPNIASTSASSSALNTLWNLYGSLGESNHGSSDGESADTPTPTEQELDWIKFQRLHRLSINKAMVPCTRCGEPVRTHYPKTPIEDVEPSELVETGTRNSSIVRRQVTCLGCDHSFCSVHGDAHPTMSCDEYLKTYKPDIESRKSETAIRQFCKPCSHCQVPIQKSEGCDHIICPSCDGDMCFKCGTHKFLEGESMVRTCTKCTQSYIDHRYMGRYRLLICLAFPFYLPFMLLHMVLTGALALVTCGCFCCFGCGVTPKAKQGEKRRRGNNKDSDFEFHPLQAVQTVLGLIFLPFVDLFHHCGLPCCCRDDALWRERKERRKENKADDDEEYLDDEEFQLRAMSTMQTQDDRSNDT